jgi:Leucine-rich repeat (LRR) protein
MERKAGKLNLRTLLAAIFCCYAVLFMVGSILFLYRKSILRRLNNDRIIKKTIALSLLDVEHPLDYITIPKTELNNKQYIQKRSEEAFNEHFSRLKKPSRLTRSDYKKIKELYISNPDLYNISLLSKLTNLEELQFYNVKVGNLEPIANLTNLKELRLRKLPAGNLEPLRNLKNLKELWLYEMPISDIEPLGNLKNLEEIRMYDVNVRNLDVLFNLKNLKVLWLLYVPVSDEQVEELQKALPDLEIDFRGKSSVQH